MRNDDILRSFAVKCCDMVGKFVKNQDARSITALQTVKKYLSHEATEGQVASVGRDAQLAVYEIRDFVERQYADIAAATCDSNAYYAATRALHGVKSVESFLHTDLAKGLIDTFIEMVYLGDRVVPRIKYHDEQ